MSSPPQDHSTTADALRTPHEGAEHQVTPNGINEKDVERSSAELEPRAEPPAAAAPPGPGLPPDGGAKAWSTVVGGWCVLFVSFGWLNTVGALQAYYEEEALTSCSSSTISWIASTQLFFFFLGGAVTGKLFDSYGPRWILIIGSFLHVFGLMMLSLSTQYYQFYLSQSVCSCWGACAVAFAAMNSTSTWFQKRRALALGLIMSGSSLGGVVFPIMITHLVPRVGFGWAIRAIAFVTLGLLIIGVPATKSRLTHTPKPFHIMEFIRPLKETPFFLLATASLMFYFGVFLPINYIQLQGQAQGMSYDLASYLIPILNAASLVGRVLPGYLGDKFGRFNVMIVVTAFTFIIVFALWVPGYGAGPIITFAVLYGFSSGAFISLVPALVAQISEIRQIGVRTGTTYALLSVTTLVGNPIGGALIGRANGDYLYMKIFTGCTMVVGTAFFLASRVSKTGWTLGIF